MKKYLVITSTCLLALMLVGFGYLYQRINQQMGYVDVPKVYEEFDLTKQLNSRYTSFTGRRQHVSDSLNLLMTRLRSSINEKTSRQEQQNVARQMQAIVDQQTQIERSNAQMKNDFESQIGSQLNTYFESFGQTNNYEVILGATGDGNVIYGHTGRDITAELIEYVNNQFNNIK